MATRKTSIIPRAPVARILMNAGAKRVSAGAADAFAEIIQQRIEDIAVRASQIAKHAGRKTVQDVDIRLAVK